MLALHSRTEISLILQKLTAKLTNLLSGGYQNLALNAAARYMRELFPERSFVDRKYPFKSVQQRIESARTELVPVPGELLNEP